MKVEKITKDFETDDLVILSTGKSVWIDVTFTGNAVVEMHKEVVEYDPYCIIPGCYECETEIENLDFEVDEELDEVEYSECEIKAKEIAEKMIQMWKIEHELY